MYVMNSGDLSGASDLHQQHMSINAELMKDPSDRLSDLAQATGY